MTGAFDKAGREVLKELLNIQESEAKAEAKKRLAASGNDAEANGAETNAVDAPIDFGLLMPPGGDQNERVDQFTLTLNQAIKGTAKTGDAYATSRLKEVSIVAHFFNSANHFRCEIRKKRYYLS